MIKERNYSELLPSYKSMATVSAKIPAFKARMGALSEDTGAVPVELLSAPPRDVEVTVLSSRVLLPSRNSGGGGGGGGRGQFRHLRLQYYYFPRGVQEMWRSRFRRLHPSSTTVLEGFWRCRRGDSGC